MLDLKIHYKTRINSIVMCVAPPLLLTGRCPCCSMRVRYPFHFFLVFFSTESPSSLQCKIRKKIIGNLPLRVLDLKEPEKIRSLWNKKKVKGFGSWLLRYQKKKKILSLAGSCASLANTYHTVSFV